MKGIPTNQMREVENALTLATSQIQEFINLAEAYKEERSEKWAESTAGEEYEDQIEELGRIFDLVDNIHAEFTHFMDGE